MDSHTFIGRVKKPWYKKIDPIWYFLNDDEQKVIDAGWYHPEWPQWWRWVYWNLFGNPVQNFRCYVIGVDRRNYNVVGRYPVLTVQRDGQGKYGWQWCVPKLKVPQAILSSWG